MKWICPNLEAVLLEKYFSNFIKSDGLLKEIQSYKSIHAGNHHYQKYNRDLDLPVVEIGVKIKLEHEEIKKYNIEYFSEKIYELCQQRVESMHRLVFESISQISALTGNIVEKKGEELSGDTMLEVLEKIEIGFDQDGNPILPTMVIHPDQFEKLKMRHVLGTIFFFSLENR